MRSSCARIVKVESVESEHKFESNPPWLLRAAE